MKNAGIQTKHQTALHKFQRIVAHNILHSSSWTLIINNNSVETDTVSHIL